ncbi:ABC transporter ATP-binding protein [Deinococcus roseus]|uniref:Heme ABC transporter ATP-binding protein n=1 Tax=Deinococcus roseus TaxID=392414 RepID=A0ABQ2DCY4_9DEIO|nr:ABC transporter ATP-binding protein [Deinococcus roseus]GGJ54030.1 heme ABC transporter ATP-binding protein [Deinococcus roseus]
MRAVQPGTAVQPITHQQITLSHITKTFPGVIANDDVTLTLRVGEVHAILGENGAGKTSLMNVLYGIYQPDRGEILLDGQAVKIDTPRAAIRLGVGLVPQHPMLVRAHTVEENIALSQIHHKGASFWNPVGNIRKRILELSERYGLKVDPRAPVWQLSAGEQQRVEILKVLLQGARFLILDEPTSVLTPQEVQELFAVLRRMRQDHGMVIITHKLDEVLDISDQITVLRKGKVTGSTPNQNLKKTDLARMMIGEELQETRLTGQPHLKGEMVHLSDAWAMGDRGAPALKGVTLTVQGGEILGVAGVAGNGQLELIEVLTGLRTLTKGQIVVKGKAMKGQGAEAFFQAGIAHVPEDRNHYGIVPNLSVEENLILRSMNQPPYSKSGLMDFARIREYARQNIQKYDIRTPSADTRARLLSGGNVQKLILARELESNPDVLVAAHPTYGLDIGATTQVHQLLLEKRAQGMGIVLVSEDLDELMNLSDRIVVIFAGTFTGTLTRAEFQREKLGLMMAGEA